LVGERKAERRGSNAVQCKQYRGKNGKPKYRIEDEDEAEMMVVVEQDGNWRGFDGNDQKKRTRFSPRPK
jgi:hypothetical protein